MLGRAGPARPPADASWMACVGRGDGARAASHVVAKLALHFAPTTLFAPSAARAIVITLCLPPVLPPHPARAALAAVTRGMLWRPELS